MFRVGDKVAHPMHGAGVIDGIVTETVAGGSQDYYVFRMPVGGLVLKIPTAASAAVGLRSAKQILISEMVLSMEEEYHAIETQVNAAMSGGQAV